MSYLALVPSMLINVKSYGAVGDGVTDDTAAIAAALSVANNAGGGTVYFPFGTYITGNQTLYPNVLIDLGGSTLKLKNGANTDLFSAQTSSISLAATYGTTANGTLSNFGMYNGILDGNKANQTSGTSYPLRFYGYKFLLRDLEIKNGYSGGALIDWNGNLTGGMEASLRDLSLHDNNGIGLQMGGPHDSRMTNIVSWSNTSHGFHFAPNAPGLLSTNIHPYHLTQSVHAVGCLCEAGGCSFVDCMFEGSDYVQFAAIASDISIMGGSIFGSTGYAGEGLRVGQPSGQTPIPGQIRQGSGSTTAVAAAGLNIHTKFQACTNGAINFWNDAGSSVFIADIFQTSGTVLVSNRFPSATNMFFLNVQGLTSDGTLNTQGGLHLASSNSNAFLFQNASGTDILDLDGSGKLLNLVNGAAIHGWSDEYVTQKYALSSADGSFYTVGKVAFGVDVNSGIECLITPDADNHNALVMYPHSSSQSVPLFVVEDSGFAPVFTVDKTGATRLQGASTFRSGSGAPSNGTGADGDYYFRTDTPGTANQRIYVRSAGVWVGIV